MNARLYIFIAACLLFPSSSKKQTPFTDGDVIQHYQTGLTISETKPLPGEDPSLIRLLDYANNPILDSEKVTQTLACREIVNDELRTTSTTVISSIEYTIENPGHSVGCLMLWVKPSNAPTISSLTTGYGDKNLDGKLDFIAEYKNGSLLFRDIQSFSKETQVFEQEVYTIFIDRLKSAYGVTQ
jgi:hypothetical protein